MGTQRKFKTQLGDGFFADEDHKRELECRVEEIFSSRIQDSPFYWMVDGGGNASILSRQSFGDSIIDSIIDGVDYEHLILDYVPAKTFREAKRESISKL